MQNYCYPAYSNATSIDQLFEERQTRPKGVVLLVHGFMDNAGRYAHIAKAIAEKGYDFYGMDQRGHGKSEGRTVLVPSLDTIADDTEAFHDKVK